MKLHNTIILVFLLLSLLGYKSKKDEISDLIENKKYSEAQELIDNLKTEERNKPEFKKLQSLINFADVTRKIEEYRKKRRYQGLSVDMILQTRFDDYPKLRDSLAHIRRSFTFEGAKYLTKKGNYFLAYYNLEDYSNDKTLTSNQQNLINSLRIKTLSGEWEGIMLKGKMHVRMLIEPISNTAFTGRVYFQEVGILSELYNGTINGNELTATNIIRISKNREIMKGVIGKLSYGRLNMTFPIVVVENKSRSDVFSESTSYKPKIVLPDTHEVFVSRSS